MPIYDNRPIFAQNVTFLPFSLSSHKFVRADPVPSTSTAPTLPCVSSVIFGRNIEVNVTSYLIFDKKIGVIM